MITTNKWVSNIVSIVLQVNRLYTIGSTGYAAEFLLESYMHTSSHPHKMQNDTMAAVKPWQWFHTGPSQLWGVGWGGGRHSLFTSPCRDRWRSGGGSPRTAFSKWVKIRRVKHTYLDYPAITHSDTHNTFLVLTTSWTYSSFSCSCLFCLPVRVARVLRTVQRKRQSQGGKKMQTITCSCLTLFYSTRGSESTREVTRRARKTKDEHK